LYGADAPWVRAFEGSEELAKTQHLAALKLDFDLFVMELSACVLPKN